MCCVCVAFKKNGADKLSDNCTKQGTLKMTRPSRMHVGATEGALCPSFRIRDKRKGKPMLHSSHTQKGTKMTQNSNSKREKISHFLLFHCLFVFSSCLATISLSNEEVEKPVGYGYKVVSARVDPSGKLLTADLVLIKNSTTFGPDIQNLNFIAR